MALPSLKLLYQATKKPEVQEALKISLTHEVTLPTQGMSSTEASSQELPVALEELQDKAPSLLLAVLCALIPAIQASSSTLLHHYCPWTTTWFWPPTCAASCPWGARAKQVLGQCPNKVQECFRITNSEPTLEVHTLRYLFFIWLL